MDPHPQGGIVKPTQGEISQILCPHCGALMDLRGFKEMGVLAPKALVECDGCKRSSRVGVVVEQTVVTLATRGHQESGPFNKVRCPVCKKPQDCTPIREMKALEAGNTLACDDCDGVSRIVSVVPQTIITLLPQRS